MLHANFKSTFVKPALLVISFLTFFSLTGKAGRDFYEIYLNKKLIVKQHAGEFSATLMNLPLENAKESDQISIFFFTAMRKEQVRVERLLRGTSRTTL